MKSGLALVLAATWFGQAAHAQYSSPQSGDRDQQTQRQQHVRDSTRQMSQVHLQRLSRLMGQDVADRSGQNIGEIENFAINPQQSAVSFVILSHNGRMVPVPWDAFEFGQADGGDVRLKIDRDHLRNAPTIQRNQLHELGSQQWNQRVHQYYGTQSTHMRNQQMPNMNDDDWYTGPRVSEPDAAIPGGYGGGMWQASPTDTVRTPRDPYTGEIIENNNRNQRFRDMDDDDLADDFDDQIDDMIEQDHNDINADDDRYQSARPRVSEPDDAIPGGYGGGMWQASPTGTVRTPRDPNTGQVLDDRNRDRRFTQDQTQNQTQMRDHSIVLADNLLEADARGVQRENLGEVQDFLVDSQSGNIAFMVVSSGGVLGVGQRLHAIPFEAVQLRPSDLQQNQIVLNIDRQQLREAPSFRRGDWSEVLAGGQLVQETYAYYGIDSPDFTYGYTAPQTQQQRPNQQGMSRDMAPQSIRQQNASEIIRNWPQESQNAAREMIQRYGQPNGAAQDVLYWVDNGPWAYSIVYREPVQHDFPRPHKDVLEQAVYYRVPATAFNDLAQFDGSIIAYRTGGTLAARCHSEPMNMLAINLAHDILNDRMTVQEARQQYAQMATQFMQGETVPYTQQLQFQPQSRNQAMDPDRPFGDNANRQPAQQQQGNRTGDSTRNNQ